MSGETDNAALVLENMKIQRRAGILLGYVEDMVKTEKDLARLVTAVERESSRLKELLEKQSA